MSSGRSCLADSVVRYALLCSARGSTKRRVVQREQPPSVLESVSFTASSPSPMLITCKFLMCREMASRRFHRAMLFTVA